jgi:hypothetical protein
MKFLRNAYGWHSLLVVLALCVLLGLFFGCSKAGKKEKNEFKPGSEWIEDMRERVADEIEDPGKKTEMLAVVDQLEKDLWELDRIVQKLYADLGTLTKDYNAIPEAFHKAIAEFEADRQVIRDRIINSRFKMRDLSTPEEWEELTDYSKRKGLFRQTIRQPG